jgi:hypothetical protein
MIPRMPEHRGQGEAVAAWVVWLVTTVLVVVTYARVDPSETYSVSRSGLPGGFGRALVHLNFPVSLAAIALVLVAMCALPRRAWWAAGPAIALCAMTPFLVDQSDLDARPLNALPAAGVAIAAGLAVAAARRARVAFQPRLPGDAVRVIAAVLTILVSLPWIWALAGFYFPGDLFMGEEPFPKPGGRIEAAVHYGGHHGLFGALLFVTALGTSRVRPDGRKLDVALLACTVALAAYGAINCVQDLWLEQISKRGWTDWSIPSAVLPDGGVMTWVTVVLALVALLLLLGERAILRR